MNTPYLKNNAPVGLAEFTQDELSQFHALAEIVRTSENAHEQEAAFKALRSLMLRPGPQEPSPLGSDPWGDDDLPKPAIRGGEGKAASRKAGVRKVRRKTGDWGSSPHAALKGRRPVLS